MNESLHDIKDDFANQTYNDNTTCSIYNSLPHILNLFYKQTRDMLIVENINISFIRNPFQGFQILKLHKISRFHMIF